MLNYHLGRGSLPAGVALCHDHRMSNVFRHGKAYIVFSIPFDEPTIHLPSVGSKTSISVSNASHTWPTALSTYVKVCYALQTLLWNQQKRWTKDFLAGGLQDDAETLANCEVGQSNGEALMGTGFCPQGPVAIKQIEKRFLANFLKLPIPPQLYQVMIPQVRMR